jgi:hypothetical protein
MLSNKYPHVIFLEVDVHVCQVRLFFVLRLLSIQPTVSLSKHQVLQYVVVVVVVVIGDLVNKK